MNLPFKKKQSYRKKDWHSQPHLFQFLDVLIVPMVTLSCFGGCLRLNLVLMRPFGNLWCAIILFFQQVLESTKHNQIHTANICWAAQFFWCANTALFCFLSKQTTLSFCKECDWHPQGLFQEIQMWIFGNTFCCLGLFYIFERVKNMN